VTDCVRSCGKSRPMASNDTAEDRSVKLVGTGTGYGGMALELSRKSAVGEPGASLSQCGDYSGDYILGGIQCIRAFNPL
jgi:hypothetical protein